MLTTTLNKITVFMAEEYTSSLSLVEGASKTPRYYQANAVNQVADFLLEGFMRILVKSPTGTGKTFISKLVALSSRIRQSLGLADDEKIRILYIANKHRLNRQAAEEYIENDSIVLIVHSAFSAIPQKIIDDGFHMTFIDECQHEAMNSIQILLDKITDRPIIGFTADDNRGDNLLLKFERVVVAITEYDAAMRGFTEKVGVNTIIDTGKTDKSILACEVLERYHTHMGNTIIFFRTEAEVKKTHRFLKKMGLKSGMLGAKSTEADMDYLLDRLSEGTIQFLVNCQRVGEGIDASFVTDVMLARNYRSAPEKKQHIGRAIRPDSPCAVWEFTDPLEDLVAAKTVVGVTKYERLIFQMKDQWHENLFSGEDETWGKMSRLRNQPESVITDFDYINEITEETQEISAKSENPEAAKVKMKTILENTVQHDKPTHATQSTPFFMSPFPLGIRVA